MNTENPETRKTPPLDRGHPYYGPDFLALAGQEKHPGIWSRLKHLWEGRRKTSLRACQNSLRSVTASSGRNPKTALKEPQQ
jgi:hypothetical protein